MPTAGHRETPGLKETAITPPARLTLSLSVLIFSIRFAAVTLIRRGPLDCIMFSSLRALLLLLATLQLTQALPSTPAYKQHATHHTRSLSNGLKIKTYHPKPSYEVYGRGLATRDFQSSTNSTNFRDGASKFIHNKFGSADDDDDMEVSSEYDGPHASHVWFRQKVVSVCIPVQCPMRDAVD